MSSQNTKLPDRTNIQFSEPQEALQEEQRGNKKLSSNEIKRLRRTASAASHTIIAYRTLSITVSENQTQGALKKSSKKKQQDLSEGNKYRVF
jgi:sodium/potassium-transporting ATPase subunit alpha